MQKTFPVSYEVEGTPIDGVVEIRKWVRNGLDKVAVGYADKFGDDLANAEKPLAASQIRNVFGEVRRIQMKMMDNWQGVDSAAHLLRPKLAYAAKRASVKVGQGEVHVADKLNAVLSEGLKEVAEGKEENDKKQRFQNFADFFEAVLAYHKANGGKD